MHGTEGWGESGMNEANFNELLSRLVDDSLTPEEVEALASFLKEHPEFVPEVRSHLKLADLISQEYDPSRSGISFMKSLETRSVAEDTADEFVRDTVAEAIKEEKQRIRTPVRARQAPAVVVERRSWRSWGALALAASAVILIGGYFMVTQRTKVGAINVSQPGISVATLARTAGGATITRDGKAIAAVANMEIRNGDTLTAPDAGKATVEYRGEMTTLTAGGGSLITFKEATEGRFIDIRAGSLQCDIARQAAGRPIVLVTEHARIEALGTKFDVFSDAAWTKVKMAEGRARMTKLANNKAAEVAGTEHGVVLRAMPGDDSLQGPYVGKPVKPPPGKTYLTKIESKASVTVTKNFRNNGYRLDNVKNLQVQVTLNDTDPVDKQLVNVNCSPGAYLYQSDWKTSSQKIIVTSIGGTTWNGQKAIVLVEMTFKVGAGGGLLRTIDKVGIRSAEGWSLSGRASEHRHPPIAGWKGGEYPMSAIDYAGLSYDPEE